MAAALLLLLALSVDTTGQSECALKQTHVEWLESLRNPPIYLDQNLGMPPPPALQSLRAIPLNLEVIQDENQPLELRMSMMNWFIRYANFSLYEVQVNYEGRDTSERGVEIELRPTVRHLAAEGVAPSDDGYYVEVYAKWCGLRKTFLSRDFQTYKLEKLAIFTGAGQNSIGLSGESFRQLGDRFWIYGVYNIPYDLRIVREENDALTFSEFLYWNDSSQYNALVSRLPEKGNTKLYNVGASFPELRDKAKCILAWWDQEHGFFEGESELYDAIEKEVQLLRAEI